MKKITLISLIAILIANFAFGQYSVTDFYDAKVKELSDPNQPGGALKPTNLVKEEENGFISFKTEPPLYHLVGAVDARTDMGYFVAKNGRKFVAISVISKIPDAGWAGEFPNFYELENDSLVYKTEKYLPWEYLAKMTPVLTKDSERSIYTKIPRIGTTIQIGTINRKQGERSFKVAYEMLFNVNNGTFRIVKK